jgi:hypothetical protein
MESSTSQLLRQRKSELSLMINDIGANFTIESKELLRRMVKQARPTLPLYSIFCVIYLEFWIDIEKSSFQISFQLLEVILLSACLGPGSIP